MFDNFKKMVQTVSSTLSTAVSNVFDYAKEKATTAIKSTIVDVIQGNDFQETAAEAVTKVAGKVAKKVREAATGAAEEALPELETFAEETVKNVKTAAKEKGLGFLDMMKGFFQNFLGNNEENKSTSIFSSIFSFIGNFLGQALSFVASIMLGATPNMGPNNNIPENEAENNKGFNFLGLAQGLVTGLFNSREREEQKREAQPTEEKSM
ncbi:MAG: hypothetical protein J0H68_07740 [Sphingobacteriia bacterium]|nr:hypothetical protein [Sphingobacteriia bacterium]